MKSNVAANPPGGVHVSRSGRGLISPQGHGDGIADGDSLQRGTRTSSSASRLPLTGSHCFSPAHMQPAIGVIGGSGIYQIDGLTNVTEHHRSRRHSDLRPTSSSAGRLAGRAGLLSPAARARPPHPPARTAAPREHLGAALARRALDHLRHRCRLAPGAIRPRHIVLPSQFFDRTSQIHTFFGDGIVAHVALRRSDQPKAAPFLEKARRLDMPVHDGGTYVNMDGPAIQHARRERNESPPRLRRHRHDQSRRGETAPRSGDRPRDDGDDHRLRLLENRRSSRDQRSSHGSPPCQCGNGEVTCFSGCSLRFPPARLARASRPRHGVRHRPQLWPADARERLRRDPRTLL